MSQLALLIRACRRPILYASLLGIVLPTTVVVLGALAIARTMPEELDLATVVIWLSNHASLITIYSAGLAAFCHVLAGLPSALEKLPVPVSAIQRAYVPLGFALFNWVVLLLLFVLAFLLGDGMSRSNGLSSLLANGAQGVPLGFFVIALANRNAGNVNSLNLLAMPFYSSPTFLIIHSTPSAFSPDLAEVNMSTWPVIALFAVLIIVETPRHRAHWRRAAFIPVPSPIHRIEIREPLAPQRFHALGIVVDFINLVATVVAFLLFLPMFSAYFGHILLGANRLPFWTEQLIVAGLLFTVGMYLLGWAMVMGLLFFQSGYLSPNSVWAQQFLRFASAFEPVILNRKLLSGKFVHRASDSGRYTMHALRTIGDANPEMSKYEAEVPNVKRRLGWMIVGQMLILCVVFNFMKNKVNADRVGSGLQGDAVSVADKNYRAGRSFAQHYVALDLGEDLAPAKLNEAYGEIQVLVANHADPESWIAGQKLLNGRAPSVPDKFRIEFSRPEPHIVIVQCMGLHWEPAGHLAYGLARLIEKEVKEGQITVKEEYPFYRSGSVFESTWGFLDNRIHWLRPEKGVGVGVGYAPAPLPSDDPIYVDLRNSERRENGKSWATAYDTIQEGIDAAYRRRVAGVWVAGGIYDEERNGEGSLYMRPGVHIYGGFSGQETVRTQRNLEANPTRIDGSTARNGEAAYHVVVGSDQTTLDGFYISGGNATSDSGIWNDHGGGYFIERGSSTIRNCNFVGNTAKYAGGGLYSFSGVTVLENCTFEANSSKKEGGAIGVAIDKILLRNCIFTNNLAIEDGDTIYAIGTSFEAENCLFTRNGGGSSSRRIIAGYEFTMRNCTLVGNENSGPRLFDGLSEKATLLNTIVWNADENLSNTQATIQHSIVPGGHPGVGNLDADPLFFNPENDDFRLSPRSPAIDAGALDRISGEDLAGNPRVSGVGVDIGVYEFTRE